MSVTVEEVVLVDQHDREVGTREKLEAHRAGLLHRAFSVMIFNSDDRLLLQKRHTGKYHSGGLWANSCCGHPRPKEDANDAAARRLHEEMGFVTTLTFLGSLLYRADVGSGLIEHEFVHIFHGRHDGPVRPDPKECDAHRWVELPVLLNEMQTAPLAFAVWFNRYADAGWPLRPSRKA